jgi:hypothetical protein
MRILLVKSAQTVNRLDGDAEQVGGAVLEQARHSQQWNLSYSGLG